MKRIFSIATALAMALMLTACGQQTDGGESSSSGTGSPSAGDSTRSTSSQTVSTAPSEASPSSSAAAENSDGRTQSKVLVAYFSWSGNTQEMASYIAEQTGADLLEIQPQTPYPTDYNECGEVALAERDNDERPAIANLPESVDEYDAILIGYPIWWHTAPMIIGTFLENYDLTGMNVYPFTQSASMDTEQFDNSIAFVRENAHGATVFDGLFARPSDTEAIDDYLMSNNLVE